MRKVLENITGLTVERKLKKKELRTSAKWLDLSVFNVHGRLSSSKVYDEKLSFPYLDGVWLKQHSDKDF